MDGGQCHGKGLGSVHGLVLRAEKQDRKDAIVQKGRGSDQMGQGACSRGQEECHPCARHARSNDPDGRGPTGSRVIKMGTMVKETHGEKKDWREEKNANQSSVTRVLGDMGGMAMAKKECQKEDCEAM